MLAGRSSPGHAPPSRPTPPKWRPGSRLPPAVISCLCGGGCTTCAWLHLGALLLPPVVSFPPVVGVCRGWTRTRGPPSCTSLTHMHAACCPGVGVPTGGDHAGGHMASREGAARPAGASRRCRPGVRAVHRRRRTPGQDERRPRPQGRARGAAGQGREGARATLVGWCVCVAWQQTEGSGGGGSDRKWAGLGS